MLQQQLLVRLAVQSALARIDPGLAEVPVKLPRQPPPHTPPASHALDDALFQQMLNPRFKDVRKQVSIRVGEVGQRLTLLNALAEDAVKPLPGSLNQAALAEAFGDTAIAWVLLPKDVLRGDADSICG